MNSFDEPYEVQAERVANTQRSAGWSEESIRLYAKEQKSLCCDAEGKLVCRMILGAGLAQDNSRFGVYEPTADAVIINKQRLEVRFSEMKGG